jgi:RNA-directed DNA polymerase
MDNKHQKTQNSLALIGRKKSEALAPPLQRYVLSKEQLLKGTYQPHPVKQVEIPKPGGKGVRKLGIPIVRDRFIQQAVMQVLQKKVDQTFSENSFGFRPKRSTHQAIAKAQEYIAQGYRVVVDMDLEKFFDTVNHDKLMGEMAK